MAEARVERRLAAILAADVAGYSRLMGVDEEATLTTLKEHRSELLDPKIAEHRGRIVKTTGDGALIEFASAVDAVRCAMEIQRAMAKRNASIPEERRIEFRIGINVGDIIIDEGDIYGDGVNIAARVETLASQGAICISDNAYQQIKGKLAIEVSDMGEQQLKNIAQPVRVFSVHLDGAPARPALALPDKPSIAVLPFNNMSGDPEQEYFADGIVEDIITALSRVKSFFVIARNSSFTYKGKAVDIKQVSRELGVRYVLEGSVRKGADRVRITAQLIDSASGSHLWAEHYDRQLTDVFAVQDEITWNIVNAIQPELTHAEIERVHRKLPENLGAWDLVLRARALSSKMTPNDNAKAKALLQQAIIIDPEYGAAYRLLSWCFAVEGFFGWSERPWNSFQEGERYVETAVRLDPDDAEPLQGLAQILIMTSRAQNAIEVARRAIELNPNSSAGYSWLAGALAFAGHPEEAIVAAERALRSSPRDPFRFGTFMTISNAHFIAGRSEVALDWARKAVQLAPNWVGGYINIAAIAAELELMPEAKAAAVKITLLAPRFRLAGVRKNPLFARKEDIERLVGGLRKAGLPE